MKKSLYGLAALPFLAGVSLAAQPVPLSDKQMDAVTAGFDFEEHTTLNLSVTWVYVDLPLATVCGSDGVCAVAVEGTTFHSGVQSLQVYYQFGP